MNYFKKIVILMLLAVSPVAMQWQIVDSVDVLDYDLTIDLSNGKPFAGTAVLTVQLTREINDFRLQLLGSVDSLVVNGVPVDEPMLAHVPVSGIATGVPFEVKVFYHGSGHVESYGFGGMHFENGMSYNLGAAFGEYPHCYGRSVYPCRDNFHDKATYTLRMITKAGWTAECSGVRQSAETDEQGREHSVWRISQEVPTYIVGVGQANFKRIERTVAGYPLTLGFTTQDSTLVSQSFAQLDSVVPMYERCFGPYRWGRIGYISTQYGSMEHVNNIALASAAMASPSNSQGQSTIAHELGHAWFGNLVTCRTEGDMWFNEGGASFTSEVAVEAVSSRTSAIAYYQKNLDKVLRTTHISDNGVFALTGMPQNITYGSTTYDKGWLVWHSLRGYMGDSLFYSSLRRLFDDKAFGTVDMAEVCDSLSSYSGMNLTDFFRFHVATPGFVDYHVDFRGNLLTISQQGVFTDSLARGNRVPLTFVSSDWQTAKRWYTFSGRDTTLTVEGLPFEAAYCLLDKDCEISDAATRGELQISGNSEKSIEVAHFRMQANDAPNAVRVFVDHHWGQPYGIDTTEGVVRSAGRYWTVQGNVDWQSGVTGYFRYTRGTKPDLTYAQLDRGFYDSQATLDSIVLMHRYNSREPWRCVTRHRTGTKDEGYFTCPLEQGEYTLAVVDTALLSIGNMSLCNGHFTLFPNPVQRGEALTIDVPEGVYKVEIYDVAGRRVWHRDGVAAGKKIRPNLKKGTYLVIIKNKSVSLQSNLIQL